MDDRVVYRYTAVDGFLSGVPARDLGEVDVAGYSEELRATIEACGLYERVEIKAKKAARPAPEGDLP